MKRQTKLFFSLVVALGLLLVTFSGNSQTTVVTSNGLSVEIKISNPCSGSSNGFIQFKVLTSTGQAKLQVIGPTIPSSLLVQTNFPASGIYIHNPTQTLPAGAYNYLIVDDVDVVSTTALGGTFPALTLTALPAIVINTISLVNNSNCTTPNGNVIASVSGGSKLPTLAPTPGSFTYTWSANNGTAGLPLTATYDGTGNLDLTASLGHGLAGGIYTLQIVDNYSVCTQTQNFTIADPSVTFTTTKTDVTGCFGNNNGSITVTASGGSGSYSYSRDNGATFQASNIFSSLLANTYQILVKDATGCLSTAAAVTINQPPAVTFTDVKTDVTCNGGTNGTITVTASGGSGAGYTYSNDNGVTFQASNVFNGLAANTYQIKVKDGAGCISAATGVTIGQPTAVTFTDVKTNVTCNGGTNGTITVTASGGSGAGYTYSNDNGATFQASNVFNGLAANTYQIIVKDGAGCSSTATGVTIGQPTAVTFTDVKTDVTCNGGTNGTITVTASGGSGAGYTYSKNNGGTFQASNVFNGLAANTYQIKVKDGAGCISAATGVTIGQPTAVTFTDVKTDATCNGGADGTITVTASGGSGAGYTYSKNNGGTFQASNVFNGLAANTYQIKVKDGAGCISAATGVTIGQPTAVTFTDVKTDVTCNGGTNGTITVTASGGSGAGYTYSNDNGATFQASNVFNGLAANTYQIKVKDGAGCISAATGVTIGQPTAVTFTDVKTDVTCNGGTNGTITVTASGGSGAGYTYSNDNGATFQASNVFNGLAANTYQIKVKDGAACISAATGVTIGQPTAVTFTNVKTDVTCSGSTDGTITVTASGGSGAGYTYSNDNGVTFQASNVFNGLAANTYQIKVKDGAGCISAATGVTIGQPTAVTFTDVKTDVTCNGGTNGTITVTASGGSGAGYTYSNDNGATFQASNVFNGLAANTYQIKVKDGAGCISAATGVTIGQPTAVTFTDVKTDVTCSGSTNGTITVTASGGSGAGYTYSNDNGATFQASNVFNGLAANTYQIKVKDGAGCISAATGVTIGQPPAVTFTNVKTDVTCNSGTDGTITVTASGGSGAGYTYSNDNGATFQASNVFNGLAANTYQMIVKDGAGCASAATGVTIGQPTAVTFTDVKTDVTCSGSTDGTITVTASGGSGAGYTYSNDNGATFQASNVFNGLAANTYQIKVKDGVGCSSTATGVTIGQPAAVTFTDVKTDVTCNSGTDGIITVTASGGSGAGYTYSNDNGATFQASNVFNGLAANTYQIKVKDGAGCISAATGVTIGQPATVTFTDVKTDATCNGGSDGTINVTASGGNGIYTYSKDNGTTFQASNTLSGLTAGNYQVVVKDGNNCLSAATTVTINQPTAIALTTNKTDVTTCIPGNDGSITVTSASGGSGAGYTYSNDNGVTFQAGNSFATLIPGNYSIVVKDGNGCVSPPSAVTINSAGGLSFSTTQQNVSCNGGVNGSVTITTVGGSGTYTYSKDNGATFSGSGTPFTFGSLTAGTYQLVVKDGNGCQFTSSVSITEPNVLSFTTTATDALCNGSSDGTITVTPSGGTAPYRYSIDIGVTFQLSNIFNGLATGSYEIVVKDVNDCVTSVCCITINQPAVLSFTTSKTDATTCSSNDGTITVTASGGTAAYQYSADNGATFQAGNSFSALAAGTYNIVVKDAHNCTTSAGSVVISSPGGLTFTTTKTDVSCNGGNNGTITVNISGGTSPYQYSSDNGSTFQASNILGSLAASIYQIVAKDINGCQFSSSVTIGQPSAVTLTFVKVDASCAVADGSITITASGGNNIYSYSNDNGVTFQPGNAFTGLAAQTYPVVVKDGNGCLSSASSVVISSGTTTPNFTKTDATCAANDGSIVVNSVTGGTAPFQYSIDNGVTFQASNTFLNLTVATYSLVAKDVNGCTSSVVSVAVSKPASCGGTNCGAFTILATDARPTCSGQDDGTITINVSGGTPNYIATLSDPAQSFSQALAGPGPFTFINLSPSLTYTYTIQDGSGNTCTLPYSLPIQTNVQASAAGFVDAKCFNQAVGQATVTVSSGGTSPYEYSLDAGTTWISFTSPVTITNLMPAPAPYSILVRDDASDLCPAQVSVTINNAVTDIVTSFTSTDASCSNNDGTIQVGAVSGGTGPYTFRLDSVDYASLPANNTFTGLAGGTHKFTVIDANGCNKYFKTTINFPGLVNFFSTFTNPDCFGSGTNGSIVATVTSSGTFDVGITTDPANDPTVFQTVVSAGGTLVTFDGLSQGSYYVVAKPAGALCPSRSLPIAIGGGPVAVDFNIVPEDFVCFETKGIVRIAGIKGSTSVDYNYEIILAGNIIQSGTITPLQALPPDTINYTGLDKGNYQMRLFQDQSVASGCASPVSSSYKSFSITGPAASLDTLYVHRKFSLPNIATGAMLIGIQESQEEPYQLMLHLVTPHLQGQKNNYAFDSTWVRVSRNNQNLIMEFNAINLYGGDYRLSIRDTLGCTRTYDLSLDFDKDIYIPNVFTPNNDGKNDTFEILNLPGNSGLVITNRWGKEVYRSSNYQSNWNGGAEVDGVYYYNLTAGGKTYTGWVEIMHPSY